MSQREILARLAPEFEVATPGEEEALARFLFRSYVDAPEDSLTADALDLRRRILASGLVRPPKPTADRLEVALSAGDAQAKALGYRGLRWRLGAGPRRGVVLTYTTGFELIIGYVDPSRADLADRIIHLVYCHDGSNISGRR